MLHNSSHIGCSQHKRVMKSTCDYLVSNITARPTVDRWTMCASLGVSLTVVVKPFGSLE